MGARLGIVSAVNNDSVFAQALASSPIVRAGRVPVRVERGHASAGRAYNCGAAQMHAEYIVFAHQDVYLPAGWDEKLLAAIGKLDAAGEAWAVLGVWGVRPDGRFSGRVWCSGGNQEHVGLIDRPVEVASIDEVVIVLKRSAGMRFDEELPGFHLYATDIILQARQRAAKAFVIDAPVVHNSWCNPQPLDPAFWSAYRYMQKKWIHQLPVRTCVVDLTRWGWPLYVQWTRNELARRRGRVRPGPRHPDPKHIAARLGYEPADPAISF
jgi:hypothetical protein